MSDDEELSPSGESWSASPKEEDYLLRLYITGMTPRSTAAVARIKSICEEHLEGHYVLEVIDVYQQPELARKEQIIATPTLVKHLPLPAKRLVGDLSDINRVLPALNLGDGVDPRP